MAIRICVAGATGWVGKELITAICAPEASKKFTLSAAVAPGATGQHIGQILDLASPGVIVSQTVADALASAPTDVLIDYTHPEVVFDNIKTAVQNKVCAVVGTSGLTSKDYDRIDVLARQHGVGVIASGNFSLSAMWMQRLALQAAKDFSHWEILDYAGSGKPDAPSGTARELAFRLKEINTPTWEVPPDQIQGPEAIRGASVDNSQIHSLRIPGFILSTEIIFGHDDERLTIRHDSGTSARAYVNGTLMAAEKAVTVKGLIRGLDRILQANG
ncbi:MAG TPA: 4-hydroxy-tetrahydrodipicolinate reductase [Desulfotignum sp.]|nr:4-hydroxy-tetrahydrodipicolinate reductase [Desulfotignum sp.]